MQMDMRSEERITATRAIQIMTSAAEFTCKMLDISTRGLGLFSDFGLKLGDIVNVAFSLPGYEQTHQLQLEAQVCHLTPVRGKQMVGLEFTHPTAHTKLVIYEYANYHHQYD